jgi:hypothetical protein
MEDNINNLWFYKNQRLNSYSHGESLIWNCFGLVDFEFDKIRQCRVSIDRFMFWSSQEKWEENNIA